MSLTFDPNLTAILSGATSKIDFANKLNAAIGSPRVLRAFRDSSSNAINPFATGTEFMNAHMSGILTFTAGAITGFGSVDAFNSHTAADLGSGTSCLRIEGNGHYIQGTLGLDATRDFAFTDNPTATSGVGFSKSASLSAFALLASGTGPIAPADDVDKPVGFQVITYADPANPVTSATVFASVRDPDIVMDHPTLAANMGDIKVNRVPDNGGLVIGTGGDCFRFAMTVLGMNGSVNAEVPGKALWEVIINCVPHNRWVGYPFRANLNLATDTLAPQAFKVNVMRADGSILHVFEMFSTRDVNNTPGSGKPINNSTQTENKDVGPVQPWFTCQMSLYYRSNLSVRNTKMSHFLPGVKPDALDGTNVTAFDAGPDQWPVITGNYLSNSLMNWRVAPKWSRQLGAGFEPGAAVDPNLNYGQMSRDSYVSQLIGTDYEPGSTGQHIWFMSPGGSRHDRGAWPHVAVAWASNPTAIRPHGNVTLEHLMEQWCYGYANEGMHYHTNLEQGITLSLENVNGTQPVCYNDTYYNGGNENYVPDTPNHAIRLLTAANAQHDGFLTDVHGRLFTGQYQRDTQHNYSNAASMSYLRNMAAGVIFGKHSFDSNMLCNFTYTQLQFPFQDFLTRQHAWYQWQLVNMWMITSNDPRSISREQLESIWEAHLTQVHDTVYPYLTDSGTQGLCLQNLGTFVTEQIISSNASHYLIPVTDSKAFYMGQVLLLMKQSGAWAAMRARSTKCAQILDLIVTCLAKQSIDYFVDCAGRGENYYPGYSFIPTPHTTSESYVPPVNWGVWYPIGTQVLIDNRVSPTALVALQDMITSTDGHTLDYYGNYGYVEMHNTQHYRCQFVHIMNDYFPEFNYPRLAQAIGVVDGFYARVAAGFAAGTIPQWHWRFAMMGIFNAPDNLGAPY